jgi:cytochrome P450/nitrite reductase/ring-hydroxylating ferredoxin subunit
MNGPGPFAGSGAGREIVLLHGSTGLVAYEGRCPHRGALLGEGELEDGKLVCRNHRWRFDVESGRRDGGPECLASCPVRETDQVVLADVAALPDERTRSESLRAIADLPGPPRLPLLGSAHLIEPTALHLTLESWARQYGTPFSYRFGAREVLVLSGADEMEPVLRERPARFRRVDTLEPVMRELGTAGVFSAEGEAWRPQRRLSMEALSHKNLRGFYPTLRMVAERLQRRWSRAAVSGDTFDLSEELKRFTVDVTTQLVFGYDINTIEKADNVIQHKLGLIFPTFSRRLLTLIPWWRVFRLPRDRAVDRAVAELRAWLSGLVSQTRARLEMDPSRAERPSNFLEAMLCATDDAGRPFDEATIFGNAMTMLLAGEDTTAYSLAWGVHHLLDTPDCAARLSAEADRELGESLVPHDLETANRLLYAGAVATEAMRLRSVAPVFFLQACEDTTVADVRVPAGTQIVLLTRAAGMDGKAFSNPADFRPSRWIEPEDGPHEPGAHQPFGSGPRICPGRSLALLEMKVVLGTLYRSFAVRRVGLSSDVREVFSFTMKPNELRVSLAART